MMPERRVACYALDRSPRFSVRIPLDLPMKPLEVSRAWIGVTNLVRAAVRLAPLIIAACGPSTAANPFVSDAGPDAEIPDDAGSEGGLSEDGGPIDDTLGGPCNDDTQCDDEIDCTIDSCDASIGKCRHSPDDAACQNGAYCDGIERCDTKLGCRFGAPVSCSDGKVCTIDTCVEATGACTHDLRDADQDGVPDGHCSANGDCNDDDPSIGPHVAEVCGNNRDDNCDGVIDESTCSSPEHDGCLDPFVIEAPGSYSLDTTAAKLDFAATCSVGNQASARDVVAAIVLPAGDPVDIEITAKTNSDVAIALFGQCGDPSSEIACSGSYFSNEGGRIAKVRARNIGSPDKPTALPLYVFTDTNAEVIVDVAFLSPTPPPTNETCGTAIPIALNTPVVADVVDADIDVGIGCGSLVGDLLYSFELTEPSNVHIYASSIDGDGWPVVSLRNAACALPEDEITCQNAENVHIFRHSLAAGTYYMAVSAGAPTVVTATVIKEAPTSPSADETCEGSPVLEPNKTIDVSFLNRQDDINLECASSAVDVAYRLDLPVASDVLLTQRISSGDSVAVSLAKPTCAGIDDSLMCKYASQTPIRVNKRNVPAGEYRVVAESTLGQPTQLTAFVRKSSPAVIVPFADGCADVLAIPESGGFFQGNTANLTPSFDAGCDQAGGPALGARDQLLQLTLSSKKRVVFDMSGSSFTTLLDVRRGPDCPGTEVFQGCAVGYGQNKSFLDLTLDAGVYFIQIDGFNQEAGPWFLDVRVVDVP